MRTLFRLLCFLSLPLCPLTAADANDAAQSLASPDGHLEVTFRLGERGRPAFDVAYRDIPIVIGSLGLEFAGSGALRENLKVVGVRRASHDEVYTIAVGKASAARDHHNELVVSLEEMPPPHRKLDLALRAFDDGVAFRYFIPEQEPLRDFVLTDEHTRLSFPGDPKAKVLPLKGYTTPYEWYYDSKPVSELRADQLIGLPMLLAYPQKVWLAVTEANLTDYAGMYLSGAEAKPGTLVSKLSPLPGRKDGAKVRGKTPFASPWRVVMVADNPGRLIESNLVFHLSDPPAIKDTSWIKPGKTTFPWWNHYVLEGVDFKPGVNTATMKHYIDFCAEQGIPYHTLDGLDIAWYGGPIAPKGPTDVTKAAPSIDMPELLRHAKEKGVRLRLWMHWKALKQQLDEAFRTYEQWGIEGVMIDFMDRDDQEMVSWYHEVAAKAARHHLTVTWHGAYKPTGMERTWPNVLSYEAALNQEYNKWQPPGVKGTPPEHNLDIAFVRMLAGPLDYHQGGMRNVLPQDYRFRDVAPPVQGTRGHQLAMYVVYQNHLPMMADYPQAYRGQPGLEFLVEVPTTWDETRVLHAELGQCLVIARRKGDAWYFGGMTADQQHELDLQLDFLGKGSFEAELYQDDPAGGPTAVTRRKQIVAATDKLRIVMPPSGGFAARLLRDVR
ncbi:MAG TPA: glycoside hydrolase family 97 protein [Pirellulaceae bacterium]|nr:glycoside hydrolase family 97 protein [Pirellulaceae bacterium]